MHKTQRGFTLIELLIVMVIIVILAAIALPQYQNYVNKAKFTELVAAAAPHKIAVELCSMEVEIEECDSGQHGITGKYTKPEDDTTGHVGAIEVVDGVINITADKNLGHSVRPTYVLTPNFNSAFMAWRIGGTCREAKLC
jgi:type IV pilus assembly protein PilA